MVLLGAVEVFLFIGAGVLFAFTIQGLEKWSRVFVVLALILIGFLAGGTLAVQQIWLSIFFHILLVFLGALAWQRYLPRPRR